MPFGIKAKFLPSIRRFLPYVVFVVTVFLLYGYGVLNNLENWVQDSFYQRPKVASPEIYVIGIDENTLMELGPFETWSRDGTAALIEVLNASPDTAPAVIGVDIGFYGEKGVEQDSLLAQAAKKGGNVVVGSYASFGGEIVESDDGFYAKRVAQTLERPYPALAESSRSGFTNVIPDDDGIVRRNLFRLDAPDGTSEFSFAYSIYSAYTGQEITPPLDANEQWYLPFSARAGDYFGVSFSDLLAQPELAAQFAGAVVLIGPYSAGMQDAYYTPLSRSNQMYGVEVHANILQALLEQNFKQALPSEVSLAILIAVLAFSFLLSHKLDLRIVGILFVVFTALYLWLAVNCYTRGWVLPIAYPLLSLWAACLLQIFLRYLHEVQSRRKIMDLFGRYVSPQVAGSILKQGSEALSLGGQTRDIAVLFVDIRGFTALSEGMEPKQVVEILNRFFALTTQAVFEYGGTVDKFIGDATMAVFNAPLALEDYVFRAVQAGLQITQGAKGLEEEIARLYGKKVGFGVGINCGPAVVGNIGTEFRMEYTAIGDTVNTASRLEGQAAAGEVLISDAVCRRLEGRISIESIGGRMLKGKSGEVQIFRVKQKEAVVDEL